MAARADPASGTVSSAGGPHEIPWQTLFFWMACLAINSVSQPNGRLLGASYKHRAVLRASPVLCAFDAIETVASWFLYSLSSPSRLTIWNIRIAATRILSRRVVDGNGETDLGAIRTAVAQSRLRWMAFAIGVLPAVLKVYGSQGIPWSQAFGTMYLASWLLFEILLSTARLDDIAFEQINIQPITPPITPFLHRCCCVAAVILHAALYSLPVAYFNAYGTFYQVISVFCYFPVWNQCLLSLTQPPPWGNMGIAGIMGFVAYVCVVVLAGSTIILPLVMMLAHSNGEPSPMFNIILPVCAGAVMAIGAVLYYQGRMNSLLPAIRVADAVLYPFFVYALLYDPAGTYQPLWFSWFG